MSHIGFDGPEESYVCGNCAATLTRDQFEKAKQWGDKCPHNCGDLLEGYKRVDPPEEKG